MHLIERMVRDMCANGFMNGWGGDVSEKFMASQIRWWESQRGKPPIRRLITSLDGNCSNLFQYCGWSVEECAQLCAMFGTKVVPEPERHTVFGHSVEEA